MAGDWPDQHAYWPQQSIKINVKKLCWIWLWNGLRMACFRLILTKFWWKPVCDNTFWRFKKWATYMKVVQIEAISCCIAYLISQQKRCPVICAKETDHINAKLTNRLLITQIAKGSAWHEADFMGYKYPKNYVSRPTALPYYTKCQKWCSNMRTSNIPISISISMKIGGHFSYKNMGSRSHLSERYSASTALREKTKPDL